MKILGLLSSEEACSRLFRMVRWRNGVRCPRCGSGRVKGHGNYGRGLKRYMCRACGRTFNDKTGTIFHYSRLSLREWFMLMLLFLGLHNSGLGLSWLLDRRYMPVFRALKRLMLSLRGPQPVRMDGAVESDEVYVTAGLKGRNNSHRIKRLGRRPRRRGLRRRGRGTWSEDKPAVFVLVERGGPEDYVPSSDVEAETALKVIGRRVSEGSSVYTDCFRAYLGLSEAGYRHEAVNHSEGEWVRGEVHINGCENRASLLRPWLAVHRGICKDNLSLYLAAFKACRRSRGMSPEEAIKEILKTVLIFMALLAILRGHPSPETAIPGGQPQKSYLRAFQIFE
jgi:transposase